jgi:hypothetical protein
MRMRRITLFAIVIGASTACGAESPFIGGRSADEQVGEIGAWADALPAFSTTYHVRPPGGSHGAGDGSSWTDALSGLPGKLERGARYLIASGDYYEGPPDDGYHRELDDPEQGELFIGLVKATDGDHGSDDGWEASLDEGPARFGPLAFVTGRYVIDGRRGSGDGEYGIEIRTRDCALRATIPISDPVAYPWNTQSHHMLFTHVDIGDCGTHDDPATPSQDAIYNVAAIQHIVYRSCHVHDAWRGLHFMQAGFDVLIEANRFSRAGLHHESHTIALRDTMNVIIRGNFMVDSQNVFISLQNTRNVFITSNVLTRSLRDWDVWSAIHSQEPAKNTTIAGNTFWGLTGLNTGIRFTGPVEDLMVVNNLFAGNRTNQIMMSGDHSHNAYFDNLRVDGESPVSLDDRVDEETAQILSDDPFVDAAGFDFTLAVPTAPGLALDVPLDVDMCGNARGADGTWDRGAFEYAD